jgi:predicted  nucleic acid-binding Zn-ribbon protein
VSAFETLLEIQERDTAADRLRRRRATLPERSELAALDEQRAALDTRLVAARARRGLVADHQAKLEDEVASLDRRIGDLDRRLYSGEISASRDLQAMAAEIESLKALRSLVENDALAAIEEAEPLAQEVAGLEAERADLDGRAELLRRGIAEAEAAIDADVAAEEHAKAQMTGAVPADLLSTYERLRAKFGGVGAARLVGNSCSGCHLTLPMSELARIKKQPPDELVLCDQCGRILVR